MDIIWLTPFFVSPMRDHGYDVADYDAVDASFGGDAALTALLHEAHTRGLRVVGDLVINHSSDQHRWFLASASSRDDPHRKYYVWADPNPAGGPPNNWLSHFGGPAWTFSPATGQYYMHLFGSDQPDLNWRHPAVADDVDAIVRRWMRRGIDGFRIDTAAYLVKHPDLPDNPPLQDGRLSPIRGVTDAWRRQDHRHDIHQPDVHRIHERWRRIADEHGAFLVGEVYELDPVRLARYVSDERLHSSFWFGLVEAEWDPAEIHDLVQNAVAASNRLSWVQGNHDRSRAATRFGSGELGRRRSLALHVAMALLPGTLWFYQGEEIGLEDGSVPAERRRDPLGGVEGSPGRDGARTPMPWMPTPGLGFTDGDPWLPLGDRTAADTVAVQRSEPSSHLNTVRRLLRARRWALAARATRADAEVTVRRCRTAGDAFVTVIHRDGLWIVANLHDTASGLVELPAPAIYDTDDPLVTCSHAQRGPVSLAPQQALLLASDAAVTA